MLYYFDDDMGIIHFHRGKFENDVKAIEWAQVLVNEYGAHNSILYTWQDKMKKIKEWMK